MRKLLKYSLLYNNLVYRSSELRGINNYQQDFDQSICEETREFFWQKNLDLVSWNTQPQTILDKSHKNPGFWRWFADGSLNMSYNCLDRHLSLLGDKPALHWYSTMAHRDRTYTFREMHKEVATLAGVYSRLGIKKGDRIIIYMPQIPEAIFAMQASSRIGAIHSVVFGGFAAKELASRIKDSQASLIVTASHGLEPNKILDYKQIVDEALEIAQNYTSKVLIVQRNEVHTQSTTNKDSRHLDYHTAMQFCDPIDPVPVESTHPLYIIYTSGTTGSPKGIVRDTGGTAMALAWSMKHIMNIHQGNCYFAGSDIGWVVGHSYICYGPNLRGAASVLFEGKPVGTPDASQYWRIIQKYGVTGLFTSPTAMRSIRKEDPEGKLIKQFNLESLNNFCLAGERCDVPTFKWIQQHFKMLINDNYWQTETGWPMCSNFRNLHTFPIKAGSAIKPVPGYNLKILKENFEEIQEPEKLGLLVVKLPMPPSFMLTIYQNDRAYEEKYLAQCPGYYLTGDSGYFDKQGYINIMARTDDVINTAGHRLSASAIEESLNQHQEVVESAVVGKIDDLKGEIPIGFVVLRSLDNLDEKFLEKELVQLVRQDIGPVASFYSCIFVNKLPKTRSGKILRAILKKLVDGVKLSQIQVPTTIEDPAVLEAVEQKVDAKKLGSSQTIYFVDHDDQVKDE